MNREIPTLNGWPDHRKWILYSDLMNYNDFTLVSSGTGAGLSLSYSGAFQSNHYGIATISTGTTSTGRAMISPFISYQIVPAYGAHRCTVILQTPSSLSTLADRYAIRGGLGRTTTAYTDFFGAYFVYRDDLSANWLAYTYPTSGVLSSTDTGIAVATSTWYRLEIEVDKAASKIGYFINGALVASVTATMQSGVTYAYSPTCGILKATGTNNRSMLLDYIAAAGDADR